MSKLRSTVIGSAFGTLTVALPASNTSCAPGSAVAPRTNDGGVDLRWWNGSGTGNWSALRLFTAYHPSVSTTRGRTARTV